MIKSFLQYIRYEKNYSSYTVLSYKKDLEQLQGFIRTQKGDFDPALLSSIDLREWVISLMDVGERPSSVKRKISAVRSFYKYLNLKHLTDNNPTLRIIMPKVPKSLPKFFSEKDMDNCLEVSKNNCTFEGIRDSLIIEIIYQTGLRSSEVISLKDKDVDCSKMQLKVLGKGNKERIIPFGPDLMNRIEEYRSVRNREVDQVDKTFFLRKNGVAMSYSQIYYIVRKIMGRVSTQKQRSPHVLRHTFATMMLNDGADVNSIKEFLGHESLAATEVYTHATFDQIKNIYQRTHPRGKK